MPVRNEAWILGASLRIALKWCDEAILLNHASTDDTADIISQVEEEHRGRVHVLSESNSAWPEMDHRQRLLEAARHRKATHVALVDADEVLTGDWLVDIRATFEQLRPGEHVHVGMPCLWRGLHQYRVGQSLWSNRHDLCIGFMDRPELGIGWHAAGGYDHHHREPYGTSLAGRIYDSGGVMHLQWLSWKRLVAKHALYKTIERIKYPNKPIPKIDNTYSDALDETGIQLADCPAAWWEPYQRLLGHIDLDSEPWQAAECRRLVALHGVENFAGLNLYGIVEQEPCPA